MKKWAHSEKSDAQATGRWLTMLWCAGLLGTATAEPSAPASYRFTLDGKPIRPEITPVFGVEGAPAPGDVVKVGGFLMVLGAAGDHVFRSDGEDQLLGSIPGMDAEACVAVKLRKTMGENDEWIMINPLSSMTDAEKSLLRGVLIKDRPADLDGALAESRWEHTVLKVDRGMAEENSGETLD